MSSVPNPSTWATGQDSMTAKQSEFLQLLCEEHGVQFNPEWSKGEASAKIDELKNGKAVSTDAPEERSDAPVTEPTKNDGDGSLLENPQNWTTGGEDATERQKRYIAAMASRVGEDPNEGQGMKKGEASAKIDELKKETGM